MKNPYHRNGISLTASARRAFAIAPNDAAELPQVCKALRIWNPGAAPADIAVETVGGDQVVLRVPPESLWVESLVIAKVLATGTTAGVSLLGYSD